MFAHQAMGNAVDLAGLQAPKPEKKVCLSRADWVRVKRYEVIHSIVFPYSTLKEAVQQTRHCWLIMCYALLFAEIELRIAFQMRVPRRRVQHMSMIWGMQPSHGKIFSAWNCPWNPVTVHTVHAGARGGLPVWSWWWDTSGKLGPNACSCWKWVVGDGCWFACADNDNMGGSGILSFHELWSHVLPSWVLK